MRPFDHRPALAPCVLAVALATAAYTGGSTEAAAAAAVRPAKSLPGEEGPAGEDVEDDAATPAEREDAGASPDDTRDEDAVEGGDVAESDDEGGEGGEGGEGDGSEGGDSPDDDASRSNIENIEGSRAGGDASETAAERRARRAREREARRAAAPNAATGDDDRGTIGRGPPIPTETPNMPRKPLLKPKGKVAEDLEVRVTGSISVNANYRAWPNAEGTGAEGPAANFGRIAVGLDGRYKGIVVSADYRFYGRYATIHHGYLGYQHKDVFELDVGVHRVPFGILPYASHNWFETIPYYLGLADDYDLGLKSIIHKGGLDVHLAYYVRAEPSQFGTTIDSARYSYDLVETDETELGDSGVTSAQSNVEQHTGVARVAYEWTHQRGDTTEIGASGLAGGLRNKETGDYGYRWAAAAHYTGTYRGWNLQIEGLYYRMAPQNPAGQSRMWVAMGAWDAPYRVARQGFVVVGNLAYRLPLRGKLFEWVMFYNDHSYMWKPDEGFAATHMNVTGVLLANKYVYIYLDAATGRNHPWFSPEYGNALAEGEDDPHWWMWLNLSIGFYM